MTFYDFMQNFLGDDTPLGELATAINKDVNFPKNVSDPETILTYCRSRKWSDANLMSITKRALDLFSQFVLM
ncbi:sterile alpha motif-like domain-containing protein [Staphylococcus sp. SQ8-PEA]|uniref:Sterile alpha motif-like domain-containing protein n=1 Tax=Staphylococcus marylandisciuri TaxID=2981529 RepID=A0ABT2QN09_9STAP|nr:sterile alpha motif-like domain-containing protein [Staphylococcus marylandisciuri]MCU5745364.1 sterile alpha motif-like domain-containing protein [Staphylococcus marylandisciuri]